MAQAQLQKNSVIIYSPGLINDSPRKSLIVKHHQMVKCLPTMWETRVQSLDWEDPLERETATHSRTAAAAAKSLQSCQPLWPHRQQLTRLPCSRGSPSKNTGVSCHFLLQCMKVKSESKVAQLYPTLCDPLDSSLPGSSIHGIFQARVLEWGAIAFSNCSPVLLPGKSHGWRSLVGYSPWGHKESDTTEWLHFLSLSLQSISRSSLQHLTSFKEDKKKPIPCPPEDGNLVGKLSWGPWARGW